MKIGFRVTGREEVVSENDEEVLKHVAFEPGVVYEVRAVIEPRGGKPPEELLYEVVRAVRREYPGIVINYIELKKRGDGKYEAVVQVFDDPGAGWQLIIILALLAILGTIIYFTVVKITEVVAPPTMNILLIGLAILLAGIGIAKIRDEER